MKGLILEWGDNIKYDKYTFYFFRPWFPLSLMIKRPVNIIELFT